MTNGGIGDILSVILKRMYIDHSFNSSGTHTPIPGKPDESFFQKGGLFEERIRLHVSKAGTNVPPLKDTAIFWAAYQEERFAGWHAWVHILCAPLSLCRRSPWYLINTHPVVAAIRTPPLSRMNKRRKDHAVKKEFDKLWPYFKTMWLWPGIPLPHKATLRWLSETLFVSARHGLVSLKVTSFTHADLRLKV